MLFQAPKKIAYIEIEAHAHSEAVKEAKQIREQQERRNVQYLESSSESLAWIEPFAFSHKLELCLACLDLKTQLSTQETLWAIGNSPSWFAKLMPTLGGQSIKHFNYSGKIYYDIYLSKHNPELLDEDKSAVVKAFTLKHVQGMRAYLKAQTINPLAFIAQEKISIIDYIHSGTSLLSFFLFMQHWAEDELNKRVTCPKQWLAQKELSCIKPILEKVSLTEIGIHKITCIKDLKEVNELLMLLKSKVHAQVLPGHSRVRYYLTHNQLPSLGLQLPPKLWDKANHWLVYEQYPDRYALKALQEMKLLLSMVESLQLMEQTYALGQPLCVLPCLKALLASNRHAELDMTHFTHIVGHELSILIQKGHVNQLCLHQQIEQDYGSVDGLVDAIYNKINPQPKQTFSGFQSASRL